MAVFKPFKAYRYVSESTDITDLAAPPYDVISPKERKRYLKRAEHNVVALELPDGSNDVDAEDSKYKHSAELWNKWIEEGVLKQDEKPALYLLEQRFEVEGEPLCRRALIGETQLVNFEEKIVLPHEHTLPKALGDRFALLEATDANYSQVFGLYSDKTRLENELFDAAIAGGVIAEATVDGVVSTLYMLDDEKLLERFTNMMADKQIFIADGHHRYTVALAHRDEERKRGAAADAASEYVMMALVNIDDPNVRILPYHRAAKAEGEFDCEHALAILRENFDVFELDEVTAMATYDGLETYPLPAYLIVAYDKKAPEGLRYFSVSLKEDSNPAELIPGEKSAAWKSLDVSVLQQLIVEPITGVTSDKPETTVRLTFSKNASDVIDAVRDRRADIAILLRPTKMEQIKEISLGGETMPQKSTYFYPKLSSGLVFRSTK